MHKYTFSPQLPVTATVTVLGENDLQKHLLQGQVIHCAGRIMKIETEEAITPNETLRIDVEGGLVLAEVAHCTALDEGGFAWYVKIRQVIPSVSDLAKLVAAVLGQRPEGEGYERRRESDVAGEMPAGVLQPRSSR